MKRVLFALAVFVSLFATSAAASMVRVVEVLDGRTIVVDDNGRHVSVTLEGVAFADDEASDAAEYLRRLVLGKWVLADGAFVFRSPDALAVNAEMARHPWRGLPRFLYLGEVNPSGRQAAPRFPSAPQPHPTGAKGHTPWHARSRSARHHSHS
jgi:hypothetical protein